MPGTQTKEGIILRIDAHQHFWDLDTGLNDWPTPDLKAIYKSFLPEDLEQHLQKHRISKTVAVQAAPIVEETEFLLELAAEHESIGGVVGWIDMASNQFPELFERFRGHQKFVGIRPMLQSLDDDQWILKPEVKRNIQILVDQDFPLDILIFPRHLPHIVELLKKFPTLRAVIDHGAKPNIKDKQWEPWAAYLEEVSAFENVMCKISGLVTEADHNKWKVSDFKPYINHIITCFGSKRIMFGSDWPVCLLAAEYDDVVGIVNENLQKEISDEEIELLFGGNAKKFYRL